MPTTQQQTERFLDAGGSPDPGLWRPGLLTYIPAKPLSELIQLFWLFRGQSAPSSRERVMPDGSMQLIINLAEDRLRIYSGESPGEYATVPGSLISGMRSQSFLIDTGGQEWVMGIHFKSGGALPFLGPPGNETRDLSLPLDTFWGSGAGCLRERLLAAPTSQAKFKLLEGYLLARAGALPARHPAVDFALQHLQRVPASVSQSSLAEKIGYSQRRFIEIFSREVGLTPKLFGRIMRFQRALQLIYRQAPVDWAAVAFDCGYYDQAHFIHDFKKFSGMSPSAYLAAGGRHPNHVAVRAEARAAGRVPDEPR